MKAFAYKSHLSVEQKQVHWELTTLVTKVVTTEVVVTTFKGL